MSPPIDISVLGDHDKIALSWSGGKDSTAVLHLLRHELPRRDITVYHCDTGDLLPEMVAHVESIAPLLPKFVRIETNVQGWIEQHGTPSDLIPYSQHAIGKAMAEHGGDLQPRYECCYQNLMSPVFDRALADGCTLFIRGVKRVDMRRLPFEDGATDRGMTIWYPLLDWTHDDVFAYLREQGVTLPRIYQYVTNAPECARCTAWWQEGRAAYLHEFYPRLAEDYQARLRQVVAEIGPSVDALGAELSAGL